MSLDSLESSRMMSDNSCNSQLHGPPISKLIILVGVLCGGNTWTYWIRADNAYCWRMSLSLYFISDGHPDIIVNSD